MKCHSHFLDEQICILGCSQSQMWQIIEMHCRKYRSSALLADTVNNSRRSKDTYCSLISGSLCGLYHMYLTVFLLSRFDAGCTVFVTAEVARLSASRHINQQQLFLCHSVTIRQASSCIFKYRTFQCSGMLG